MQYPTTRRADTEVTVAGLTFPDPYQWLATATEEVQAWDDAQNRYADEYLRSWPHYEQVRQLVADNLEPTWVGKIPEFAGGYWYRKQRPPDSNYGRLERSRSLDGAWEFLLDADRPPALEPWASGPRNIEWFRPSPDGRYLAFGLTRDGSEQNDLYLLDCDGKTLCDFGPAELINDNWGGGATWLPDSSGFYFAALVESSAREFRNGLYFYDMLQRGSTSELQDLDLGTGVDSYVCPQISTDGQHLVASAGLFEPQPRYIRELGPDGAWRPFIRHVAGVISGRVVDRRYIAMTDIGARRGRVVAIDLNSPAPEDPATWQELLTESEATKRTVWVAGGFVYVLEFVDTFSRIQIVDLDGKSHGTVPLPAHAVVADAPYPFMDLPSGGHPDELIFSVSTLTSSSSLCRFTGPGHAVEVVTAPAITFPGAVIISREAVSADRTRIPYHIVQPKAADTGPKPCLVYGYGNLNAPFWPNFPWYGMAAFIAAGGVFVHTHLRGGAEFGRDWWQAARNDTKQRSYDDLYAIAEDLLQRGVTTTAQMAVHGQSGGGMLAAVAATQRPELWVASAPSKPFVDLIGACATPYGRAIVDDEFARIDDPDSVWNLATFSPYELAERHARYPAMFVDAGATDTRCPAWHSRKLVARLQESNTADTPILIKVRPGVGHGISNGLQETIDQTSDWLSFVMRALDMHLSPTSHR